MKKEIVQQIFNEYHQHAQIILQTGNADVFYTTLKEDYNPKLKFIFLPPITLLHLQYH